MYSLILEDFHKWGRCDFKLAKEADSVMMLALPTFKHSPYTEQISRG